MKFTLESETHEAILATYPNAKTLIEYIQEHGELPVGSVMVNNPSVSPTILTEQMLKNMFPSLQEAFWWYVV